MGLTSVKWLPHTYKTSVLVKTTLLYIVDNIIIDSHFLDNTILDNKSVRFVHDRKILARLRVTYLFKTSEDKIMFSTKTFFHLDD